MLLERTQFLLPGHIIMFKKKIKNNTRHVMINTRIIFFFKSKPRGGCNDTQSFFYRCDTVTYTKET